MAQYVHAPTKSFPHNGNDIGQHLRLKYLSTGKVDVAGAADVEVGTAWEPVIVSSGLPGTRQNVPVWLRTAEGTAKFVANGAIAVGALVYGAASGKVGTTVNGNLVGRNMETAATADGDVIEVERLPLGADGAANGNKIVVGEVTLDGSNPTPIVTGLSVVLGCQVTRKSAVAPALDPLLFSVDYGGGVTAGTVNVYAWKATASGDGTEIASANATAVLSYTAYGTP